MHRRHLLAVAAAGALVLGTATSASAGDPLELPVNVFPTYDREVPTFEFEVGTEDEDCLDSLAYEVVDYDDNTIADVTVDGDAGTIEVGPSVPPGGYLLVVTCTNGQEQRAEGTGDFAFALGHVDKVVEGEAPDDATFLVEVACEGEGPPDEAPIDGVAVAGLGGLPFTLEFEYPAAGGTEHFVVYNEQSCEVTETEDGGAESVAITGGAEGDGAFSFPDAADETVVVTNTFAGATPAPPPAARPVTAEPNLTG